jgi:hypothetical protein
MMKTSEQLSSEAGVSAACQALSVPRSSYYRARKPRQEPKCLLTFTNWASAVIA